MIQEVKPQGDTGWDPTIGVKLGPAWLAAAAHLKSGKWYSSHDLCGVMVDASGLGHFKVFGRIKGALRRGYLEESYGEHPVHGRTLIVRVTDHGRVERPELRGDQ